MDLQEYGLPQSDLEDANGTGWNSELGQQRAHARQQLAEVWRQALQGAVDQFAVDCIAGLDRVLDQVYTRASGTFEQQSAEQASSAAAAAEKRAITNYSSELNQALRRLRQAATPEEVTNWLLDAAAAHSPRLAVFAISGPLLQGLSLRGVESEPSRDLFESLDIPLVDAPAMAQCKEACDTVVSIASPSQVSSQVASIFHHQARDRVYLVPVVVRQEAAAIVYVTQPDGVLDLSAIELLAQAAGMAAESLVPVQSRIPVASDPAPTDLVQIQPSQALMLSPRRIQELNWSELDKEEQEFHLGARRFARVHVAEMRLFHAEAVEQGRRRSSLYSSLKSQIDEVRENFRLKYISAAPSMIDYLHLELVRSLAHDNPALLGSNYPGPLV